MSQYEEIEKQLKEAELKDAAEGNLNSKDNGNKTNKKETGTEEGSAGEESNSGNSGNSGNAGNSGSPAAAAAVANPADGSSEPEGGSSTGSDSGSGEAVESTEKPWYESDGENQSVPETAAVLTPAAEEEDEEVRLFKEYKKSGKTLKEFVKEFDLTDYNALSDAEIIQKGLKELENFAGEEYEAAVEEVAQMSLFQKKKLIQEYRSAFVAQNEEKLKQLSSVPDKQQAQVTVAANRFETEMESFAKAISGKELYGLKVTDEMSTKIKDYLTKEINFNRKDGSLDVELLADFAMWRLYGKDIVRTNVTKAKNDGRKEMLIATTNPSTGSGPSNLSNSFASNGAADAFGDYLNAKKR